MEENEADLGKLRRWLETVGRRDLFVAAGREPAGRAVREAADAVRRFAEQAARRDEEPAP